MKTLLTLICSMFLTLSAYASTFDVGVKGGYLHSDLDNADVSSGGKQDTAMYGIYGEWNATSWLAVGAAYNAFCNQSITTPIKDQDLDVHGPEVYGKLTYHFDNSDLALFARGGVMYTFANGDGDLGNDNRFVPLAGVGAQWQVFPFMGVRVGYDRYFDVFEGSAEVGNVKSDFDVFYLGANVTF